MNDISYEIIDSGYNPSFMIVEYKLSNGIRTMNLPLPIDNHGNILEGTELDSFILSFAPTQESQQYPTISEEAQIKIKNLVQLSSLTTQQEIAIQKLRDQVNELTRNYLKEYPIVEIETFIDQRTEAEKFLATNNPNDAPLLNIIAQNRGLLLSTLCEKVLIKSNQFKEVSSKLIARRQALEDKIKRAKSIQELQNLNLILSE